MNKATALTPLPRHNRSQVLGVTVVDDAVVVDAADMLDTAFARLQSCNCHTLPVTSRGTLVGLLTMENVGEFLLIQSAS